MRGGKKRGIREEGLGIRAGRKPPSCDFVGTFRGSPGEVRGGLDAVWCGGFEFGWRVHALLPSRLVVLRDGAQRGLASGCVCVSRSGGGDGVVGIVNARRGDARGMWCSDGILRTDWEIGGSFCGGRGAVGEGIGMSLVDRAHTTRLEVISSGIEAQWIACWVIR